MGHERAEEYGKRNAVPGELIVRLRPAKVIATFDVSGLRAAGQPRDHVSGAEAGLSQEWVADLNAFVLLARVEVR